MQLPDELLFEEQDGMAILTLNRPSKYNALNDTIREGIVQVCQEVGRDRQILDEGLGVADVEPVVGIANYGVVLKLAEPVYDAINVEVEEGRDRSRQVREEGHIFRYVDLVGRGHH